MGKLNLILLAICVMLASCSKERERGTACLSANTTTAVTNELITIANCGDELPSQYVSTSLDWGDGTITSGQTGTHAYVTAGTYNIRLLLNGDYAPDVTDVDESKVKIQITVN